jgi:di/tricarboxylate transporter
MPRTLSSYPTAPLAAASLIGGYAVAVSTGSRSLGGVVLAAGGLTCVRVWAIRRDKRTAAQLAAVGLTAFVLSHVLALAIGAWPAALLVSGATATIVWLRADAPALGSIRGASRGGL